MLHSSNLIHQIVGACLGDLLEARHSGFNAARRGQPTSSNPYKAARKRIAWIGGYSEARARATDLIAAVPSPQ